MSALPGNKNAVGNSGGKKGRSGRYSAYKETNRAKLLEEMFFETIDKEAMVLKIKSGNYSLQEVFLLKALGGDMRAIVAMFNKLFPDCEKTPTNFVKPIPIGAQNNE